MASSKIDIANLALKKIGARKITSFDQANNNEAVAVKNAYNDILKEVLEEHPWTFAQRRVTLSYVVSSDTSRTIEVDTFSPVAMTGATQANPVVITADNHGFDNGDKIIITGVSGMTELNGNTYYVEGKTNDTFQLVDEDNDNIDGSAFTAYTSGGQIQRATHNTPITITGATQADPVVITTLAAHGLAVNDWIKIIGVNGMTDLNDNFYQVNAVPSTTTFSLKATDDDDGGDTTDGTGFSAYTYGGIVLPAPELVVIGTYVPVVYQKPSDLIKVIKKSSECAYVTIEDDKIISDTDSLKVIYTFLNLNVSEYSSKFVQALSTRLAAEIAFEITNSVNKSRELLSLYESKVLPAAIAVDSTRGSPDEIIQDEWIDAMELGTFPATVGETWHPV